MGRGLAPEKIFSENVDRLISGLEVREVPETDQDLQTALDFARLMQLNRPQPGAQFQADLKARLLQKLAQQEAEVKPAWFQRLIPRQPVWQFVSVVAVILVIGGIVLGLVLRDGGSTPVVQAPVTTAPAMTGTTPAVTTTATTYATATLATSTAPATSAAPTSTVLSGLQGIQISADATTDQSTYAPGEPVVIKVTLKNSGLRPVTFTQYPPILSLLSAAGNPVLSFQAGQSGLTLGVGDAVSFFEYWNQSDAKNRVVPAGSYHLELEDIDLQGQAYKIKLSQPVSFEITN
jgi:hypothetical protein